MKGENLTTKADKVRILAGTEEMDGTASRISALGLMAQPDQRAPATREVGTLPELVRQTKLLRVLWASEEDELEAVMGGETVAIGISLSASLNQDAGLRPPLASRAQLSKFVLDMFNQRRDKRWDEKSHRTVGPPLYAMRPEMPTWTP